MWEGRHSSPLYEEIKGDENLGSSSKLTEGQFGISVGKRKASNNHCNITIICINVRNALRQKWTGHVHGTRPSN